MKSVYLGLDHNCYTSHREEIDCLGGSERFLVTIGKWLKEENYEVCKDKNPGTKEYDLAIFSNVSDDRVKSKKRVLFSGSWHTDAATVEYDEVVNVSEYMREKTGVGIIIPACFTKEILNYKDGMYVPNRIFCHSNPNRHYFHTLNICRSLEQEGINFHWILTGGNRLYSDNFGECFCEELNGKIHYRGTLSRKEMLGLLSSAHVFAYPNFTDKSETLSVAPIEAMALGITTILPNREPFKSCHKGAILCNNEREFVEEIKFALERDRETYDVSKYHEDTIRVQWITLVKKVIGD